MGVWDCCCYCCCCYSYVYPDRVVWERKDVIVRLYLDLDRKNPAVHRGLHWCWRYVLVQAQTWGVGLVAGQVNNTEENQADSLHWSWRKMCSTWLDERFVKMILFSTEKGAFVLVTPLILEFFENYSEIIITYECDLIFI